MSPSFGQVRAEFAVQCSRKVFVGRRFGWQQAVVVHHAAAGQVDAGDEMSVDDPQRATVIDSFLPVPPLFARE